MDVLHLLWFSQTFSILLSNVLATDGAQNNSSLSNENLGKKVLIVLTSEDKLGITGKATGWYLPDLAIPYKSLIDAGFEMDAVSPKGGKAPVDPGSEEAFKNDAVCQWFQKDDEAQDLVGNTKTPNQINPSDYAAVLYPGGHGPMFDVANDEAVAKITSQVFEKGGVVAAVGHGPAGLVPVKVNGGPIVKGRHVTALSNAEENELKLDELMPFSLERKLKEQGGHFSAAEPWQDHVLVDGRLVTGQNPASSGRMVKEMIKLLD